MNKLELLKLKKLEAICRDPVLWAKACLLTVDNATKKIVPWTARWYQAEMLRDPSIKKVARCGRRTGEYIALLRQIAGIPAVFSRGGNQQRTCPHFAGRTYRDWTRSLSSGDLSKPVN